MTPKSVKVSTLYLRKSTLRQDFDLNETMLQPLNARLSCEFPGLIFLAEDARQTARLFTDALGFHSATIFSSSLAEK